MTFENMPLTNLTVSVDSQVDGGTSRRSTATPRLPDLRTATTGSEW